MFSFSTWSIKTKLWVFSSVLMLNIVAVACIASWKGNQLIGLIQNFDKVQVPAVRKVTMIDMFHDGIRAAVYKSIVISGTKNQEELKEARADIAELSDNMKQNIEQLDKLDIKPDTHAQINEVRPTLEAYVAAGQKVHEMALSGKTEEAMAQLPMFKEKFEELEKKLEKLGHLVMDDASQLDVVAASAEKSSNILYASLVVGGLMFGLTLAFVLVRVLTTSLMAVATKLINESNTLAASAQEVSSTSSSLTASVSSQASAVQETAASLEEIQSMVKKTEESSAELSTATKATHESSLDGQRSVADLMAAINDIKGTNQSTLESFSSANGKILEIVGIIKDIGEKTRVINDIVFQTKLLSFNASVEAARAGEHGKGFAVVAEEVGNLAQMSGNAAKEITAMLETGIQRATAIMEETKSSAESLTVSAREKTERGIAMAEKCNVAFSQIVNQVGEINQRTVDIGSAVSEQTTGLGEIAKAINIFSAGAQQSSTMSAQSSQISDSLLAQSESLHNVIEGLKSVIGARGAEDAAVGIANVSNVVAFDAEKKSTATSSSRAA